MSIYEINEKLRTETDEAKVTELIIERDRLRKIENEQRRELTAGEAHAAMLDYTHN